MKKIKKAKDGDTTSVKTTSGPRGQFKAYTTESGGKKVTGKISKKTDKKGGEWERSSRKMTNPGAVEGDTLRSDRERGGGTDVTGKKRTAEMHDYSIKEKSGVRKVKSMTETRDGKTTVNSKTSFKKAQGGTSVGIKPVSLTKAKGGKMVKGKCKGGC